MLQRNPRVWGGHLTSQLSWIAAWLLVTCVLCPFWANGGSADVSSMHSESGFSSMGSWCYCREWLWNSRTKLCWITFGEWNASRVLQQDLILGIFFGLITIYFSGLMVGKSELKSSSSRSFPERGEFEFAFPFWHCEPPLKNQFGEREYLIMLFWHALIVGGGGGGGVGRLERWERGKDGEVEKVQHLVGWWGEKARGSWFYSRLGDAKWVQDFIFLALMLMKRTERISRFFVWP